MNSIANNQMSHSCGHIEPLFSPKNPFIIGVIAIYFSPFFFDHPVLCSNLHLNPIRAGGAESARTFFKHPFLHEKRGLEVPNFVTFPNSL